MAGHWEQTKSDTFTNITDYEYIFTEQYYLNNLSSSPDTTWIWYWNETKLHSSRRSSSSWNTRRVSFRTSAIIAIRSLYANIHITLMSIVNGIKQHTLKVTVQDIIMRARFTPLYSYQCESIQCSINGEQFWLVLLPFHRSSQFKTLNNFLVLKISQDMLIVMST